jgi:hypothetical protein
VAWRHRRSKRRKAAAKSPGPSKTQNEFDSFSGNPSSATPHATSKHSCRAATGATSRSGSTSASGSLAPSCSQASDARLQHVAAEPLSTSHDASEARVTAAAVAAGVRAGAAALRSSHSDTSSDSRQRPAVPRPAIAYRDISGQTGGSSSRDSNAIVYAARSQVANAVLQMQGELQEELHEDRLSIYSVLGRGGFGTVYHGARCASL